MATGWSSKQKRRWASLSVDETPGTFRRLGEDEARRAEWPAATLPSSALNGKDTVTPQGHSNVTETHQGHGKDMVSQQEHGKDTVTQQEHGKPALSASLPRAKREDKKPSLFTAFTWSKGKKSRPKLREGEEGENVTAQHDNKGTEAEGADCPSSSHDYSERAVDVPNEELSTHKPTRLSSNSSCSSSSNKSSSMSKSHVLVDSEESTTKKTRSSKKAKIETISASTPKTEILEANSDAESHRSAEAIRSEQGAAPNDTDEGTARETERGESKFDTGRRFRLEATVMVDDERPAERRVTYLGPVLLSPLGQQQHQGQYVHVTVAPGSGGEAAEGSCLMVRPAQPVLIQASSASAAKGGDGGEDGRQITLRPKPQSQEEGAKELAPFQSGGSEVESTVLFTNQQDSSPKFSESAAGVEVDVMDVTQSYQVTLGTAPAADPPASLTVELSPPSVNDQGIDDDQDTKRSGDGDKYSGDALPLDSGQESLVVMTENCEIELEPAPSPIPVDQSVFGKSSPSQCRSLELGSMVSPADEKDRGMVMPISAPRAPLRRYRLSSSSSSSTSSLSYSSTSSSDCKSKHKSYDFGQSAEKLSEDSEIHKPAGIEKDIIEPKQWTNTTKDLKSEGAITSEKPKATETVVSHADSPQRISSFERSHPELLDPHVLLAADGGKLKTGSRDPSPAVEARCSLKIQTTAGLHIPENVSQTVAKSEAIHISEQEVQKDQQAALEPTVINVIEETGSRDLHEVISNTTSPQTYVDNGPKKSSDKSADQTMSVKANQDESPSEISQEEPVMRQSVNRPQKPARTSLVKEEIIIASAAPLNSEIDRPLLPLKRTPRTSSSSSSSSTSDSEDGTSKNKSAYGVNENTSLQEIPPTANGSTSQVLDSEPERKSDSSNVEKHLQFQDEKTDSSENEWHDPQTHFEGSPEDPKYNSSMNSSQFVTDTSLTEQVDSSDFTEPEIHVTNEVMTEVAPAFSAPFDSAMPQADHQHLCNSLFSSGSSYSQKHDSDSERSRSSSTSGKRDGRRPPVFVTPPPPPVKPVRSCGSQSDLSERSDIELDLSRTPPKPARSMDRLSPNMFSTSDRDKSTGNSSMSVPSASSSGETEHEAEPPVVPPRRDKPRVNGADHTGSNDSGDSSVHTSFSSCDDSKSAQFSRQDNVDTATPSITEQNVDQLKPQTITVQLLNKTSDRTGASKFVPYEESGIYYMDSTSPKKNKTEQSIDLPQISGSSEQTNKGTSPKDKNRKFDKSSSSSDESKKAAEYTPPPVPPRQKMSNKVVTKITPGLNSSTSSSVSQESKESHEHPPHHAKLSRLPGPALKGVPGSVHPVIVLQSDTGRDAQTDACTSPHHDLLPETHDKRNSSFELEVPWQTETSDPEFSGHQIYHSDVKLPLKPIRTPSPKLAKARTPSPKVGPPQTPSPEISPRLSKPTFRPISPPGTFNVMADSVHHTDEDTSEADVKSPRRRSISMSSTMSATSHEDDKGKKGSKSKLRKYWPFRRKKGDKKDKQQKGTGTDTERSVSSPHLASLPLHQSTPTLERHASVPDASANSTSDSFDKRVKSKPADSDTSALSKSANQRDRENKAKAKSSDGKKEKLSVSTSSTEQDKKKKKKDKESDKKENLSLSASSFENDKRKKIKDKEKDSKKTVNKQKEKMDSSGNRSTGSSPNVTPTPERKADATKKTEPKKDAKLGSDKPSDKGKEHDTSTSSSSSSSSKSSKDTKTAKGKEDTEEKSFEDLPLTPPRVATPLREHTPTFYPVAVHQPQVDMQQHHFDGEFQHLDDDLQADADAATALAERRPPMVVVAVDLGTTHSGYAFSFSRDPSSVYVMSRWAGQEPGLLNHKTLSALLLTPDARFHSFGLAARNHYHNLLPIEARHWLYFERFKMTLHHCKELSRDTMVTAVNGKQLPALTVFAHVLEFFATHALQQLSDQSGTEFRRQDVRWVVTVPAIWREPAKQLMRQAALVGGMFTRADPSQLLIVLEPEAASIYCRRLRMHQLMPEVGTARPLQSPRRSMELLTNSSPAVSNLTVDGSKSCESLDSLSEPTLETKVKGTRYLVVDCGGGTVDITVHELTSSGQLVELHRATGGPHGSTGVDTEFEAMLRSIFSNDFIDNYKRQFPVGWVNLMTDFESRKRAASPFKTTSFNVSLPFTFISEYRKHKGEVDQAVKRHGDPEVEWSLQGMLRLAPAAMRRLFAPTLVSIRQAVGDVLNHPNTRELRYLFLVGGFAESPLLQQEVRREFGHLLTVLIPQDVSLAVLRGAVLFGLDPKVVSVRCARLTYGVGILNRFDPSRHPTQKRVHRDGVDWCTDVFDRFVAINQPVSLGTSVTRRYTPARSGQLLIVLNIYSSVNPSPTFITDPGVRKCGTLYLDLRITHTEDSSVKSEDGGEVEGGGGDSDLPREILARMAFGDTEISVTALDVTSGKEVKASVDFLSG